MIRISTAVTGVLCALLCVLALSSWCLAHEQVLTVRDDITAAVAAKDFVQGGPGSSKRTLRHPPQWQRRAQLECVAV